MYSTMYYVLVVSSTSTTYIVYSILDTTVAKSWVYYVLASSGRHVAADMVVVLAS